MSGYCQYSEKNVAENIDDVSSLRTEMVLFVVQYLHWMPEKKTYFSLNRDF